MMKKAVLNKKRTQDILFCWILLALPVIQFAIFYIGVNINSFIMVFQRWEVDTATGLGSYVGNGFGNFKELYQMLQSHNLFWTTIKNSAISFVMVTLVGISFALIFSLYIFKKYPGAGVFRILLFAPSILSAAVTVTMFRSFAEGAARELFNLQDGLLTMAEFPTIIFYNIWIGFGMQILMYSGAMNGIEPSVLEAARLDGVGPFREFFNIILPLIFPTIQTFLVTGTAGLFVNQINYVAFNSIKFGRSMTLGAYLFVGMQMDLDNSYAYPVWATFGASMTLVAAPLTLLARWLLEKYGPSVE